MPVISTNTAANTAVRYLNQNASEQSSSLGKLASGSRINRASDDAAGLAISTKIKSDIAALDQASTNASHAIAVLQIADGAASNISDILQRMKALASESSSSTMGDTERTYIDAEYQALLEEIDGIAGSTRYNGLSLLDSDATATFTSGNVMVGSSSSDTIALTMVDLTTNGLLSGLTGTAVTDTTTAAAALTALDAAINTVSNARAGFGAAMSRFEFRADSIATQNENLEAANSAIADVDIAAEQAKLSSAEVKTQAAVAAAAQANQMPQTLLKLLQ
ncbi:flagellin [Rhodoplanes azumiensis]|uniref:Flagellin n=1 Tax=Rhodoplanes azumiensis TaxID=1897628 RepID=A0ABW5AQI8_9BRAD